ncbi:aromatic motif membrane protein [Mycoplasma nasistruthionis]|uniref:Uncharacterized protein n=1 Tax=Mycoplasma nasistruthionis TaxID=353852 RepID=A0A4Y6I635_9MOLU|nr:aromatic motif membrane protein [Mycoplasma nasistruthionis]QCZ36518.1 hypothetical protein FG904_00585 [Mycoplasma nasistruthionis]QDF64812.1 hypothetical protein FIV53_00585 [Mycoplasma nasistruthionis]
MKSLTKLIGIIALGIGIGGAIPPMVYSFNSQAKFKNKNTESSQNDSESITSFKQVQTDKKLVNAPETELKVDQALSWDNFIAQDSINQILDLIYPNKESKENYIQSQKELGDDYLLKIQSALRYSNNVTQSFVPAEFDFSTFSLVKPYPIKEGDKLLNEMSTKNWLWYLFNLNNFSLIQVSEFTRDFNNNEEEFEKKSLENALLYKIFIKLKSNQISQFVVLNSVYDDEKSIFLFTSEGFILKMNLEISTDSETNETTTKTELLTYIDSFPNLLKAQDPNSIFDLNKYVTLFGEFGNDDTGKAESPRIAFLDHYGATRLRYTAIDVNK